MFLKFDENKIIEKYTKTFFIKDVLYFLTCFKKNEIVRSIKIKNVNNIKYVIEYDCLELYKGTAKQNHNLFFDQIIPTNVCNLLEINFNYPSILELEVDIIQVDSNYINEVLKVNCYFVDIRCNTILMISNGNYIIKKYSDNYKITDNIKYNNLNIIEIEPVYDEFIDASILNKVHQQYKPSIIRCTLTTNLLINNIEKENNLYKIHFFPVIYKTYIKDISIISPLEIKKLEILNVELKENEYLNYFNNSYLFYIEIESKLSGPEIYDIITNNSNLTYTNLSLTSKLLHEAELKIQKKITLREISDFNKLKFYSFFS